MESLAKAFESIITFWNSLYNWSAQGIEYRNFSSSPQIKPSVEKRNSSQAIYVDIFRCVAALWSEPCDHLHPVWSEHWHPSNFVFNQIQFSINLWLRVWVTCLHELTRFFGSNQCFISFPLILTMAHPHKQRQCHTRMRMTMGYTMLRPLRRVLQSSDERLFHY